MSVIGSIKSGSHCPSNQSHQPTNPAKRPRYHVDPGAKNKQGADKIQQPTDTLGLHSVGSGKLNALQKRCYSEPRRDVDGKSVAAITEMRLFRKRGSQPTTYLSVRRLVSCGAGPRRRGRAGRVRRAGGVGLCTRGEGRSVRASGSLPLQRDEALLLLSSPVRSSTRRDSRPHGRPRRCPRHGDCGVRPSPSR